MTAIQYTKKSGGWKVGNLKEKLMFEGTLGNYCLAQETWEAMNMGMQRGGGWGHN